jgi:hypothetical protein
MPNTNTAFEIPLTKHGIYARHMLLIQSEIQKPYIDDLWQGWQDEKCVLIFDKETLSSSAWKIRRDG